MQLELIRVSGAELLPGDRIVHPHGDAWRPVYTVAAKPRARPGAWQLECECRDAAGEKTRIAVGPTALFDIERKGKKA